MLHKNTFFTIFIILLSCFVLSSCGRPKLPESSIETTIVIPKDEKGDGVRVLANRYTNRAYAFYKKPGQEKSTILFNPITEKEIEVDGDIGTSKDLGNGDFVFYQDFRTAENHDLQYFSVADGTLTVTPVNKSAPAIFSSIGILTIDESRFIYANRFYTVKDREIIPGPRADYFWNLNRLKPIIITDEADSTTENAELRPLECNQSTKKITFDSSEVIAPYTVGPYYTATDSTLECIHALYPQLFIGYDDSDNPMRYIFMTTNPTKEGDIFTADLRGKIEDKIVRRLYKDAIIRPNATASFDSYSVANTSTYDDSVTFAIEDKDIPYGIGEYFRYKTLSVYKNDQALGLLNRLNVGVIGFSPNYLYLVSERGLERVLVK